MRGRLSRPLGALVLLVSATCFTPACANMFGLEELELAQGQDAGLPDASAQGGAGGAAGSAGTGGEGGVAADASTEADVSASDAPGDGLVEAGDATWELDVSLEALDAAEEPEPQDGAAEADVVVEAGPCPPGNKMCEGVCVPTNQATTGCALPGCEPCALPHASAMCDSKLQCVISQCEKDYEDCNSDPSDGCEAALKNDVTNCGVCGTECSYPHAQPKCAYGVCAMGACDTGWTNCDGQVANGCEVDTEADPLNCGGCGAACTYAHAAPLCQAGSCVLGACTGQYADCDGQPSNGCEVNLQSDPGNCGSCLLDCNPSGGTMVCTNAQCVVSTCAAGLGECDGSPAVLCETNLNTSVQNCGACGNVCQLANATPACITGECRVASCTAPYGNCDGNHSNGCETNTKTNLLHCGQCGTVCSGAPNAAPACTNGVCVVLCTSGYGDCDIQAANGCETSLQTSTAHCGACNNSCPAYPNATPSCAAGLCGMVCNAGYADCDGLAANGCEINLLNTVANCGMCGKQCNSNQGTPSCTSGVCAITCNAGFGNCDGAASNGCETPLNTVTDCGSCGSTCSNANGTTSCPAGVCLPVCAAGFGNCDSNASNGCETGLKTLANCGGCAVPCSFPNASASCGTGVCTFGACVAGWGNCDSDTSNGCETDLNTTVANCGTCGTTCTATNGTPSCSAGTCTIACEAGWGNCDGNAANGCETNLTADVQNCGLCAKACSFTNAAAECFGGVCSMGLCTSGWGNCDGKTSNGCETVVTTLSDCGSCGATCSLSNATATCGTGTCALVSCNAGFGNCDNNAANGCETNTNTSTNHCGACGAACSSANGTPSCTLGSCAIVCSAGFGNCDNNVTNGCEASLATTSNCGSCGAACSNPNGTTACVSGACSPQCNAGFASCDSNASNGCETNTQTDVNHCGACGAKCLNANGTTSCVAGVCVPACSPGFADCDGNGSNGCETAITSTTNCGACGVSCVNAHGGTSCVSGLCVPTCTTGWGDCDGNPANGCETDKRTNVNNCGTCGNVCVCPTGTPSCTSGVCQCTACPSGTGNCDGNAGNGCETSLKTLTDCGGCGVPCALPNAVATCATGVCLIQSCNAGWANCDGLTANGCETNTQTNLSNCGTCGTVCGAVNGTASCTLGACSIACNSGFGNCDGLASNGCEASLSTVQTCGTCTTTCTNPNGTTTCTSGVCVPSCATGYQNCDGNPVNGCEVSTQTSVANCGACGTVCTNPNGTTACVAGACTPTCSMGWGDCDGNPNNGCGTSLTTIDDCGGCDVTCTNAHGTTSCAAGVCSPVCSTGWANCDGNASNGCETSVQTSLDNCGGCGVVCSGAHATATCALGSCSLACEAGWGDCNLLASDGCETALTNKNNCGACGFACVNPHGQSSCVAGTCVPTCTAGWGSCDGDGANGCETQLTSLEDCGACATPCTRVNATATCSTGACKIFSCNPGWGNCDNNDANGCETPLNTLANCGACATQCTRANATATCSTGSCSILSCNAGWGNCDGNDTNGCETQLNTTSNCGACGTTCANAHGTTSCVAGVCSPTCSAGWGNCDSNPANGCETDLYTLSNCGACGTPCSLPNATSTCLYGVCMVQSCNAGWGNCDSNDANGCEVDLKTNQNHCGACARACGTQNVMSRSCSNGTCNSTCALGFANCNLPATGADDGCEKNVTSNAASCGSCSNACSSQGAGFVCDGGTRPPSLCGCDSNAACNPGSTTGSCATATGLCSCNNKVCNRGEACKSGNPQTCSCNGGASCSSGQTCCQTPAGCKDLQTDPASCGACGHNCPPNFTCVSGGCQCSGNTSCNAGSAGTCLSSGACQCGATTCAMGKRCMPGGACG